MHGPSREAVRSGEGMRQRLARLSVLRWVSVSPERTGTGRTGRLIPHCFRGPAPEPDPQPHGDAPEPDPCPTAGGRRPALLRPGPCPGPGPPSAAAAVAPSTCPATSAGRAARVLCSRVRPRAGTEPPASQPLTAPSPQPGWPWASLRAVCTGCRKAVGKASGHPHRQEAAAIECRRTPHGASSPQGSATDR